MNFNIEVLGETIEQFQPPPPFFLKYPIPAMVADSLIGTPATKYGNLLNLFSNQQESSAANTQRKRRI